MSTLTVGQMNQLGNALEKHGYSPELVKKLSNGDTLTLVKGVLEGTHLIVLYTKVEHIVDLGAPYGVVKIELRSDDNLYVNGEKVTLHLERKLNDSNKEFYGYSLRIKLEDNRWMVLANSVLRCIYDHPELLPEHWKQYEDEGNGYGTFWGSSCRESWGGLFHDCLRWNGRDLYLDRVYLGSGY